MAGKFEGIEAQFDSVLKKVESGQADIETAVAEYPQSEQELRQLLEIVSWLEAKRRHLNPRPEFVAASRHRLVEKIGSF
jgi:exonuclease VII small subunit